MRCKHERAPANATFCPDCGARLIAQRGEVKVPVPKHKGNIWFSQVLVGSERVYVSASTEEEYYAKARAVKLDLIERKKAEPKITLGTAIDRYLHDNANLLSPSTLNSWQSYRRTRFKKYMDMDMGAIPYQKMVNDELDYVSGKTVINAYDLVRHGIEYAGMQKPKVKLPKKSKPDPNWLDFQQIQIFIELVKGKPYELGALLALNSLRRSELLHITLGDIDLEREIINVRGASVIGAGNKLVEKTDNKTEDSTRQTHIVIPRLNYIISRLNDEDVSKNDKLIKTNPTTLYSSINSLCKRNGLPEVGVHGLRHSFASLAYHLKWSELTTMREGGWKNPDIVHRIYTHLAAQDANEDIKKMQDFYGGVSNLGSKKL